MLRIADLGSEAKKAVQRGEITLANAVVLARLVPHLLTHVSFSVLVVALTEERNRERAKSKANAKIQGLFRAMVGVLNEKIVPVKPLPLCYKPKSLKGKIIEEHVVMHLSDGHHDQIVRPEECGGLEQLGLPDRRDRPAVLRRHRQHGFSGPGRLQRESGH